MVEACSGVERETDALSLTLLLTKAINKSTQTWGGSALRGALC